MILYHGSNVEIVQIDLGKSRPNKDFGKGFYLSADYQQAMRMAQFKTKIEGGMPYVTKLLENLKYMKGITFQHFFGTERAIAKLHKQ